MSNSITTNSKNWYKKKVMVIEDDYVNYMYFKDLLKDTQAKISRSVTVSEAIKKINIYNDVSLIILNYSLPENYNGSVIKELKSKFRQIPILAYSENEADKNLRAIGADICISLHIDPNHFLETVHGLLYKEVPANTLIV